MTTIKNTKISTDGKTAHLLMSVDNTESDNPDWAPVVYGNMTPDKPHPIIMLVPIAGQTFFLVIDDLSKLARIEIREGRVFETLDEAIAEAERLAEDPEWIEQYQKYIESVVG